MQIRTITLKEFQDFSENWEHQNFHQSISYALLKSEEGYEYEMIGYFDGDSIVASALVLVQMINSYLYAYVPEGFLIDYKNENLLNNFTKDLINFYKKEGIAFIRINPTIPIAKIDNKTKNPIYNDNYRIIEILNRCGYIKIDTSKVFTSILPTYEAIVNLDNFNINNLNKNVRNKIRKCERKGLIIEKSDALSMDKLYKFIKNKIHKDMFHYSDYYNIFNKENAIDYFLVKIDNESLAINSQKAYEEEKEKNELLSKKLLKVPSERNINKKMNSDKALLCLKEDILLSNKYLANNEDNYIAGALVIKCKDKISILVSGYDKKYQSFSPNYFLFYKILMNYKNNYKFASLGGVSGNFSKESKYYGLDNFKMGFKPDIYEYIGEFDLILNKINYYFLNKKNLVEKEFQKNKYLK